uniref:Uncharacterized protein n=1 Tax=Oryza nivara TaxID=4536 RepID=A0A0E0FR45_ORYNI
MDTICRRSYLCRCFGGPSFSIIVAERLAAAQLTVGATARAGTAQLTAGKAAAPRRGPTANDDKAQRPPDAQRDGKRRHRAHEHGGGGAMSIKLGLSLQTVTEADIFARPLWHTQPYPNSRHPALSMPDSRGCRAAGGDAVLEAKRTATAAARGDQERWHEVAGARRGGNIFVAVTVSPAAETRQSWSSCRLKYGIYDWALTRQKLSHSLWHLFYTPTRLVKQIRDIILM